MSKDLWFPSDLNIAEDAMYPPIEKTEDSDMYLLQRIHTSQNPSICQFLGLLCGGGGTAHASLCPNPPLIAGGGSRSATKIIIFQ